MKIHVAQLNPIIGDITGNTKKILDAIRHGKEEGADIILCPELTICGYPPEDLVYHLSFIDAQEQALQQIINEATDVMVVVGLVRRNLYHGEKHLLNSAAIIQDGAIVGFYDKWLLPTYDVFDERRYFEPGSSIRVWPYRGKKIGIVICEDIWQHAGYVEFTHYARDPILELVPHRPDVLLNLSASPYQFQKPDVRVKVCAKAAKTLQCPVFLCCQIGANGQLIFDGASIAVDKHGKLIGQGKPFEEDHFFVDLEATKEITLEEYDSMKEIYSALVLGVKDYFNKCGFTRACIGLSGGIDSALVACIAAEALGPTNVLGLIMPSRYSSEHSVVDAKQLAMNIGMPVDELSVEEPFAAYLDVLKPLFQGMEEDVTEENIQARVRGMLLMAVSNKLGYIALSTGNKSELALGYSTLYGDMCGGLGVIGDVKKTMVYDICRWINREEEVIPRSTIDKPPSAELHPGQIDLDSLPEYGIVDKVLEGYVEDNLSRNEISVKYNIPLEIVIDLVQRIHRNEYKRRQAAPILRVTKKSFGVGRRYPLVQNWV